MTTQQRALELTDWLGGIEVNKIEPQALLAVVKSFLMMEHVVTLREAADIIEGPYQASGAASRLRALAEERSVG